MSEPTYFISISLIFGTILVIFAMKYFALAYQSRARTNAESAYRELAERAVAAQSMNATLLSSIESELSKSIARLTALEKILKEVE